MTATPRWTKAKFLEWFEQNRPELIRLTRGLFGAGLKGFSKKQAVEDVLDTVLLRSILKRRYRSCDTVMQTWFMQDVKWAILDARKKAKRTVPLEPNWRPESSATECSAEMGTSGDDAGQIEYPISDEVDDGPAAWMRCDELPPFIEPCTHCHHYYPRPVFGPISRDGRRALAVMVRKGKAASGWVCPICATNCLAKEWADYQLELRHRVARRPRSRFYPWCGSPYRRPATPATFWPAYRSGWDRLPVPGQQRDQRPWKQALRTELWNYRNRLEAMQVEAADIENTISDGLDRCMSRGSRNGHQPQLPEPWSCHFAQSSCRVESSCLHRDRVDQPIPAFVFTP